MLESEAVLIKTSQPLSEEKAEVADRMLRRIDGVLATQESKYIMLNAPEEALDKIARILPGAEAPTIIPLAGRPGHFAVHAVCKESVFWETLQKLKKAGGDDVSSVKSILADLAEREVDATADRTSIFARTVIENMGASTTMRNKPDQQAGFRVLKTAQFPSVLIELAYVTNKQDAANLQSDAWRDKVTDSIMTAIDNYFSNQVAQVPM